MISPTNKIYINSLRWIAALVLCLLNFQGQSEIKKDQIFQKGIYYSFDEVLANNPGFKGRFLSQKGQIDGWLEYDQIVSHGRTDSIYGYVLRDINGKKLKNGILNFAWGFSDGNDLYVRSATAPIFIPILYIGRYFYYKDSKIVDKQIIITENVLNINNGEHYELTDHVLKIILEVDPAIFQRYMSEPNRKAKKFDYLKEYSEKHKNEITVKYSF